MACIRTQDSKSDFVSAESFSVIGSPQTDHVVMEEPMKPLRLTWAATALCLLLAVSALAGQIGSGGVVSTAAAE
jgi:hypothetical protein